MFKVKSAYLVIAILLLVAAVATQAERGDDSGRKSKNGLTTGTIDGVEVTLEYGRPSVRGRTIWGGLVPYGKVWRTGADEATTISLSVDVTVEGQSLAAGTYGLFTIPGEEEWTVVFNEVANQWGAFNYDAGKDALRVTTTPRESEFVEAMTFEIDSSSVVLRWAELAVPFTVKRAE
jgi:hypothetical protein